MLYIDGDRLSLVLLEDMEKIYVLIADDGFLTLVIITVAAVAMVLLITIELLLEYTVYCDEFKIVEFTCTAVLLLSVTCEGKYRVTRLRLDESEKVI